MDRFANRRQVSPIHVDRLRRFVNGNTQYKAVVALRTTYETVQGILGGGFVRNHGASRLETMIDRVIP